MIFICDENHQFKAWIGYIDRLHSDELKWHYFVDTIYLDIRGKGGLFLNAMHDINNSFICEDFLPSIVIVWSFLSQCVYRSTKHSHVKTNMVHTLHRVKAVGSMPLESFKDLLTEEEFRKCASNPHLGKAWFKLTSEVFIL
jgi:hypothetical protein